MKTEFNIGPMACVTVKKIARIESSHSWTYYRIYLPGARLAATNLHAFKVIRNNKILYLPTEKLKKDDQIWIDKCAFSADGSLITVE